MELSERKVVLVTGSTSGIGANIASDLLTIGYRVIITGRDKIKLDGILNECRSKDPEGSNLQGYVANLMDNGQIDNLLSFVKQKFGHLDIVINNGCYRGQNKNILETDIEEFKQIYHMNVVVPMYIIHKSLKLLRKSNDHVQIVINISSCAGMRVVPLHGYSISKSSLSEMTQQLIREKRLLCATISPGPIFTHERPEHSAMNNLTLMNRIGTTQEISNVVIHCLRNITRYNGQEIFVDGGYLAREHVRCCIGK